MLFWNSFFGYDKKQALAYIDSMERYLVRLKRAVYNAKNGLGFSDPKPDEGIAFPKKVLFNGYNKKAFNKTLAMLKLRISLEKAQLEKLEMG